MTHSQKQKTNKRFTSKQDRSTSMTVPKQLQTTRSYSNKVQLNKSKDAILNQLTVLFLGDMTAATVFSPVVANETSRAYE